MYPMAKHQRNLFALLFALLFCVSSNNFSKPLYAAECKDAFITPMAQDYFNRKFVNTLSKYLDVNLKDRKSFAKGRFSRAFEDSVLTAHDKAYENPEITSLHERVQQTAEILAEDLNLPVEACKAVVAAYDLENFYKNHPEELEKIKASRESVFPLPSNDYRTPRAVVIESKYTKFAKNHSPSFKRYNTWKSTGQKPEARKSGEDDGALWLDILLSTFILKNRTYEKKFQKTEEFEAFLFENKEMLWILYGAYVERELFKLVDGNIIFGSDVRVGGRKHADAWKISYEQDSSASKHITIEGFYEVKSSYLGMLKARILQLRGFFERLQSHKHQIQLFGEFVSLDKIFIKTRSGKVKLEDFLRENEEWLDSKTSEEEFAEFFKDVLGNEFYEILLPKSEDVIKLLVGHYSPSMQKAENKSKIRENFAKLLSKHLGSTEVSADPLRIKEILFRDTEGIYSKIPESWKLEQFYGEVKEVEQQYVHEQNPNADPVLEEFFREGGAWEVFKIYPGYSTKTNEILDNLLGGLEESVRKEILEKYPLKPSDGGEATKKNSPIQRAQKRIYERIKATIEAYLNHEGLNQQQKDILSKAFSDGKSLEEAIEILNSFKKVSELEMEVEQFFVYTENIEILKRRLVGFSTKTDLVLNSLLDGLAPEIKNQLIENKPIKPQDGANATHKTNPNYSAQERILKRLKATMEAYLNHEGLSQQQKEVLSKAFSDSKSLEEAIEILNSFKEVSELEIEVELFFANTENIKILKKHLKGFSIKLDSLLNSLLDGLAPEIKNQIIEDNPIKPEDGSKATHKTNPNYSSQERVLKRLKAMIEAYLSHEGLSHQQKDVLSKALSDTKSLEEAIEILNSFKKVTVVEITEEEKFFSNPKNIEILKRRLVRFSTKTDLVLNSLLDGLAPKIKNQIIEESPIKPEDGSNATHKTNPNYSAQERIVKRLKATIEAFKDLPNISPKQKESLSVLEKSPSEMEGEAFSSQLSEALKIIETLSSSKRGGS